MSRYALVTRTASGDWDAMSMEDDEPQRFESLVDARDELEDHLTSAREAAESGRLDDGYSPADYGIRDDRTGRVIRVAWNREQDVLRVLVRFTDLLDQIEANANGFGVPDVDFARVVRDYGMLDNSDLILVQIPSLAGPANAMQAIAPAGWSKQEAGEFVNDLVRAENGMVASERHADPAAIHDGLLTAGFQLVSLGDDNLVVTDHWDADYSTEANNIIMDAAPGMH